MEYYVTQSNDCISSTSSKAEIDEMKKIFSEVKTSTYPEIIRYSTNPSDLIEHEQSENVMDVTSWLLPRKLVFKSRMITTSYTIQPS